MTLKELRKRKTQLVRELADLSKDGWMRAKPEDWRPVEAELIRVITEINRRSKP
jgi:hypothetical protein